MSVGISSLTSDLERMSFGGTHSAAELELQVNIQADKARANFEAYYANRIAGFDKGANLHTRLALPPLSMTDHPYITIDCGPAGFDYSHIPQLIEDQIQERIKLGRSLEQQRPISVKFRGVDYSNIEKVCRAIAMGSNETTPLERLSLAGMKLEADDAKALVELLCKNTSITDLDVSDNAWDCDGVEVICSCFATGVDGKSASNTTVKRLDLGGCSLGKAVMKRIASFLPRWEYLEHLQLNGNNIGIYGMEELCCGLRSNKSLKTLSLCNTSIGLDGLKFLAQILESGGASLEDTTKGANACAGEPSEQCELNTSLVHVQLEGNRGVEDTHELFTSIMVSLHRNVQRRVREELIKAELELREQMLDTSTTILDNIHLIQQADRARIVEESTNSIKDQNSNNAPKADKTAVSKKIPTSATVPNKKMAPPGTVSGKSGTPSGNVTQKKVPTSIAPKSLKSAPKYTTPAQSTSTGKVSKQTVSSTKTTK